MNSPAGRVIAFLRTRVFAAVIMPGLLGVAFAFQRGFFGLWRLLPIFIGLAIAEILSLLGADHQTFRNRNTGIKEPMLPGSPLLRLSVWETAAGPVTVLSLGMLGVGVLVYMTLILGPALYAFVGIALIAGLLYAGNPFPFSYLSTAILPPVISAGVYFGMTGKVEFAAFLIGLPIVWISVAAILGYRILYKGNAPPQRNQSLTILLFYFLCPVSIIILVAAGVYASMTLISLVPISLFIFMICKTLFGEGRDYMPLTAWGVSMHAAVSLILALFILL